MTLGQKLKRLRTDKNLTQKALADHLHVTFQTVSKWENDENEPDIATLKELAKLYECSLDFLLSEEEIQEIIDNGFVVPMPNYSTEESFRLDEFDSLTYEAYYHGGVFNKEPDRLISEKYDWKSNLFTCIKQVYLLKRLNITTVQVAYSRIDKISPSYLSQWKGKSENPKFWFDVTSNTINQISLHNSVSEK